MKFPLKPIALSAAILCTYICGAQSQEMLRQFQSPDIQYRPRVWWHWMDGNVSVEGIRKDLLWMAEAGVGGVQVFDAGMDADRIVAKRVSFGSPEWKEAFGAAVRIADSLGLEFAITPAGGWSDTGAPWVTPEDAMKTLNWKEMDVQGGKRIRTRLPEPNVICGKYLTHSFFSVHKTEYDFYRDIAVIAVRIPEWDRPFAELGAAISTSDGSDGGALADGDLNGVCKVVPGADGHAWVQYSFPQPTTIRAFFYARKDDWQSKPGRHWEVSDDGIIFKRVPTGMPKCNIPFVTIDIPPTTGRHFRFVCDNEGEALDYTELIPYTAAKVNNATEKAGFFTAIDLRDACPTPDYPDATAPEDVLDISDKYRDGVLNWKAPKGRWRIYRFGYTVRGRQNNPASPEARGLEIDKLDPDVTSRYYRHYLSLMDEASGYQMGKAVTHLMMDSFEAGCQTWTANMPAEFRTRRGYDLTKWLPALAGHIIWSADRTERFLQDWRQTLGEMLVDYHYDAVDSILKEYGLQRYTEFHESGRGFPVDGMEVKRNADIPMGAVWLYPDSLTHTRYKADIRESASVAHIRGRNLVAAESFTVNGDLTGEQGCSLQWDAFPSRMKGAADIAMASGLNTFVIHCSVHQPSDEKVPGLTLGKYGSWFQRHNTWSGEARPWMDYLARSSYLLRQGKFRADIAYFFSETTNLSDRFQLETPPVPEGYAFDYVNASMLDSVSRHYNALMIDSEVKGISIKALRSIKALADCGVIVAGEAPTTYLGLEDHRAEFESLVASVWGSGRGNVVPADRLPAALLATGCPPDVVMSAGLSFVHRSLEDAELYYIVNPGPKTEGLVVSFNIYGRKPTLMDPETGETKEVDYKMSNGRTCVALDMDVRDAVFILFDAQTDVLEQALPRREERADIALDGSWTIELGRGKVLDSPLFDLSCSDDNEVKYFSGTAGYTIDFSLDTIREGAEYILELGKVHSIARVFVNGHDCGLAWTEPFALDVTPAVKEGKNKIEVRVTNGWYNRLAGDAAGAENRGTATWTSPYKIPSDAPLHPAGLTGPVRLVVREGA